MWHLFIVGLFLGWGAAVPIGAINLEIIRRNLRFGTAPGVAFGMGASSADVTYLILLSLGALTFLTHPMILKVIGAAGSFIMAWFGYSALRLKTRQTEKKPSTDKPRSVLRHWSEGYLLTLINSFTILFWASVSMTIVSATKGMPYATLYAGMGVLVGAVSWDCGLNIVLHFTRHRLSQQAVRVINMAGGIILLCFAVLGLGRVLFSH